MAKKAGLSFAETNELRVSDLVDLASAIFGLEDDSPREATQADIDAFYGR